MCVWGGGGTAQTLSQKDKGVTEAGPLCVDSSWGPPLAVMTGPGREHGKALETGSPPGSITHQPPDLEPIALPLFAFVSYEPRNRVVKMTTTG